VDAAVQQRVGLGPQQHRLAGPRPGAPAQVLLHEVRRLVGARPRGPRQLHRVRRHRPPDQHPAHHLLQFQDARAIQHRVDLGRRAAGGRLGNRQLFLVAGVVHDDLEHEAVELRLGQGIRPLLLDGVLGAQDQEGLLQRVVLTRDRHLVFLHRLQERGLRLGGRAVDLVAQQDMPEDRPLDEPHPPLARPLFLVEDLGPGDVRGHQVGRELDAFEADVQDLRQRADHQGLGQPGHAHQQDVPAREDRRQDLLDHLALADDDLAQLADHHVSRVAELVQELGDPVAGSRHGGVRLGRGGSRNLATLTTIVVPRVRARQATQPPPRADPSSKPNSMVPRRRGPGGPARRIARISGRRCLRSRPQEDVCGKDRRLRAKLSRFPGVPDTSERHYAAGTWKFPTATAQLSYNGSSRSRRQPGRLGPPLAVVRRTGRTLNHPGMGPATTTRRGHRRSQSSTRPFPPRQLPRLAGGPKRARGRWGVTGDPQARTPTPRGSSGACP